MIQFMGFPMGFSNYNEGFKIVADISEGFFDPLKDNDSINGQDFC